MYWALQVEIAAPQHRTDFQFPITQAQSGGIGQAASASARPRDSSASSGPPYHLQCYHSLGFLPRSWFFFLIRPWILNTLSFFLTLLSLKSILSSGFISNRINLRLLGKLTDRSM